jgi:hypothetical protein
MRRSRRFALAVVVGILATGMIGTGAVAAARHHHRHHHHKKHHAGFPPSVDRFNLAGYKIETSYTLGRNTGNTFDQTYQAGTVQGVPVKGPAVGQTFPPVNYVAMQVAPKTLYVAWLDPQSNAIVDAFVMNFRTHVVFDYAPGSTSPESSGTVKILEKGSQRIR